MASAATGWKCTHSASVVSQNNTSATIRVTCYWENINWTYNIGHVSAWVYCNGTSYKVKTDGAVNSTSNNKVSCGSHDFTITKGTSAKNISCYAKITSTSSYVSGTKSSSSSSVSVSAKPSYTVTYNANGGGGAPSNQTKWYGTNLTLSSTTPARTGYSFSKWNTKADGTGTSYSPGATYSGNAALSLYAIWTADTYTVTYNANGGSGAPGNQTKTYGVDLTLSTTKPTRTNYYFVGWSTSPNGSVVYAAGATYTNNSAITLYAIWSLAYVKPRINGFKAQRCNSSGTASDTGTYIKVEFSWATDHAVTGIYIQYQNQESGDWITSDNFGTSGTSGTISKIIGDNNISIESSYSVKAYVSDSTTDTTHTTYSPQVSIGTVAFPIDVKKGGTGVAIGKVSEKDAFEVGMDMYDKSGQLISCKNVSHYTDETSGTRVICCFQMKIGGIYQVAISFNHNTSGSEHYRATIYAILSIPCGYNDSKVVVRPQINEMVTYHGNSFNTEHRLSAHVEGGGSEVECWYFNNIIYIYVQCTNGVPTSNWNVSVRPLVE